jgi:tetratricopeptide (TPR) repeat protein
VKKPTDPDLAYSYGGIGQCLVELGRMKEAIEPLEKALHIHLEDPEERGNSLLALAKAVGAQAAKARARSLAQQAEAEYRKAGDAEKAAKVVAWRSGLR